MTLDSEIASLLLFDDQVFIEVSLDNFLPFMEASMVSLLAFSSTLLVLMIGESLRNYLDFNTNSLTQNSGLLSSGVLKTPSTSAATGRILAPFCFSTIIVNGLVACVLVFLSNATLAFISIVIFLHLMQVRCDRENLDLSSFLRFAFIVFILAVIIDRAFLQIILMYELDAFSKIVRIVSMVLLLWMNFKVCSRYLHAQNRLSQRFNSIP